MFQSFVTKSAAPAFMPSTARPIDPHAVMSTTGSHQNLPPSTIAHRPPRARTLSASGSRNAPERVVPCFRAR